MHPMLNIAIQAARAAGKLIVQFLDHLDSTDINEKARHDFVTRADEIAEEEINAYPAHSILAEETGLRQGDEKFCWIIDPLDGTTNFIHGFPQFAVSIAVKINNKLEVAVVYDPLRQELFTACRGKGAHLNNRRIRVSTCKKLDNALIGTGFPFRKSQQLSFFLDTFKAVFPNVAGVRRAGSAALDLAYVATGRLDGFWEMCLKPWDISAGTLLIREAGGIISDFQGEDNYLESGDVVTGTPKIHKPILELIQSALKE
jgi:myo-inositol-1(or 4)-monophosphatase